MDEFREARVDRLIESIPLLTRIFRYGEWENVLRAPSGSPGGGRFVGKGDFASIISRVDDATQARVTDLLDVSASVRERSVNPSESRPRMRGRQSRADRAKGRARGKVSSGQKEPVESEERAKQRSIDDAKTLAAEIGYAPFTREGSGELRTRQGESTKAGGGVVMPAGTTVGAGRSGGDQAVISSETALIAATEKFDRANVTLRGLREKSESLQVQALSLRQQADVDNLPLPEGVTRVARDAEGEIRAARDRKRLIQRADKIDVERQILLVKIQNQTERTQDLGRDVESARKSRDAARDAARNIGTTREREQLLDSDQKQEERRRVAASWSRSAAYSKTIMANWHRRNDDALNAAREAAKDRERSRGVTDVKEMDSSGFHDDERVKVAMDDLRKQFAEFTVDGVPYDAVSVPDYEEAIGSPPSSEVPGGTFSPTKRPWFDRDPPWVRGGWNDGESLEDDVNGWIYGGDRDKTSTRPAPLLTREQRLERRRVTLGRESVQSASRALMMRGDVSFAGTAAIFMDSFDEVLAKDNPRTVEALKASFARAVGVTKRKLVTDERLEAFSKVSQLLNVRLQSGFSDDSDREVRSLVDDISGRFSDPSKDLRTAITLIDEEIADKGRVKGVPKTEILRRANRRRMLSQFGITDLKNASLVSERDARQKQVDDFRSNEPDRRKAGVPDRPGSKIRRGTATPENLQSPLNASRARAGVVVPVERKIDVRGKDVRYVAGMDNQRDSVIITDPKTNATEVIDVRGKRLMASRSRNGDIVALTITGSEEQERELIPGAPSPLTTMRWEGQGGVSRSKTQTPLRVKRRRALADQVAALRIERDDLAGTRFEQMKDYGSPEAQRIQSARAEVKEISGFAQEVTERRQRIAQIDNELSGMPKNWTRKRQPIVDERADLVSQIDTFFANAQRQVNKELDRMQEPSLGDTPTPAANFARMEVRRLDIQVQIDAIDSVMYRRRAVRNTDDPRGKLVTELFGPNQTQTSLGTIRDGLKSELNALTGKITVERTRITSSDARAALDAIESEMKKYDERGLMTSDRRLRAEKISSAISELIIKRPPARKPRPSKAPARASGARGALPTTATRAVTSMSDVVIPDPPRRGFKHTTPSKQRGNAKFVVNMLIKYYAAKDEKEKADSLDRALRTFVRNGVTVADLRANVAQRDDVDSVRIPRIFNDAMKRYEGVPTQPKETPAKKSAAKPAAKAAPKKTAAKRSPVKKAPVRRTTSTGEVRPSQKPRRTDVVPPLATAPVPEGGLTDAARNTRLRLLVTLLTRGQEREARRMFDINGFTAKQVRDWAKQSGSSVKIPRSLTRG